MTEENGENHNLSPLKQCLSQTPLEVSLMPPKEGLRQAEMYIYFPPSDIKAEGKFQLPWHAPAGTL